MQPGSQVRILPGGQVPSGLAGRRQVVGDAVYASWTAKVMPEAMREGIVPNDDIQEVASPTRLTLIVGGYAAPRKTPSTEMLDRPATLHVACPTGTVHILRPNTVCFCQPLNCECS